MVTFKKGYWGWLKTYSMAAIAADSTAEVQISENDKQDAGFFNVMDINNNAAEDIVVWVNGDSNRAIHVNNGTSKQLNGTRFTQLVVKNKDGTNATDAGEVLITIQKELGNREFLELQSESKAAGGCGSGGC